MMRNKKRQICLLLCGVLLVVGFGLSVTAAHQCSHGHHHNHHHPNDEDVGAAKNDRQQRRQRLLLPEEDLKMMLADHDEHDHDDGHKHDGDLMPSGLGLWIHAMGCSLLVSLASLICLILLPLIFIQGKSSEAVVDSLALFGRTTDNRATENGIEICAESISDANAESLDRKDPIKSQPNLVFGYLNLFSNAVIGDFGILVRSGFSVCKALFNFLSALVALAGTALVCSLLLNLPALIYLFDFLPQILRTAAIRHDTAGFDVSFLLVLLNVVILYSFLVNVGYCRRLYLHRPCRCFG